MTTLTNRADAVERIVTVYQQCSDSQQTILRVLAVVNKWVSQTKFIAVLNELEHFDSFAGQQLAQRFNVDVKKRFASDGLIEVSAKGMKISVELAAHLCRLCAMNNSYDEIVDAAELIVPVVPIMHWQEPDLADRQRIVRDFFYRARFDVCEELLKFHKNPQVIDHQFNQCLIELCFYPMDLGLFNRLPSSIQYQAFASLLHQLRGELIDNSCAIECLRVVQQSNLDNDNLRLLLAEQLLFSDQLSMANELLPRHEQSSYALQLRGSSAFLSGAPHQSIELFEAAIKAKNKFNRRKKQYIGGVTGLFHLMALLQLGSDEQPEQLSILAKYIDHQHSDSKSDNTYHTSYAALSKMGLLLTGRSSQFQLIDPLSHDKNYASQLQIIIGALCYYWANEKPNGVYLSAFEQAVEDLEHINQILWSQVGAVLLAKWQLRGSEPVIDGFNLCEMIDKKESWALALEQLIALDSAQVAAAKNERVSKESRIIWLFSSFHWGDGFEAKEQKLGKHGWSKGRQISLKRLSDETASFDYLSEGDIAMCKAISRSHSGGYYGRDIYELSGYKALGAAVGLDNVYREDDLLQPIVIERVEPELLITQNRDGFLLSMANLPSDLNNDGWSYSLTLHSKHVYWLTHFDATHLKIASIVSEGGLQVPTIAKEQVLKSIGAIAPMLNIQSNIEGVSTGVETVVCDKRLFINIEPANEGLMFDCHVEPLGPHGPILSPGIGHVTFATQVNGERVSTTRDLLHEQRQLQLLTEQCPSFTSMIDNRLVAERIEDALFALEQLEAACVINDAVTAQDKLDIVIQWPQGKNFKLSPKLSSDHLKLSVTKQKEWFGLEGVLEIGEEQVIELQTLMLLVARNNSRFIKLDDGQILSLTDELRGRLQAIEQATVDGQFHPLVSPLIDSATQGMRLKTLDAWERQREILHQANQFQPQLPSTLQAELRDYQLDGFNWASRLAFWGGGACLADDMGLGKTLQALAVILSRAQQGPTLVLAPTSVCFNWVQEATRFAPTLKIKVFGEASDIDKRQQLLDGLGAFDLVICSYGILQREGERLATVKWQSIVADEAQALKNPLAKRTQAAMGLSAHFKMITTGTPVENNLTELWTLFRFINPGLLGSQKQFHKRFAGVIENTKDNDGGARLRANNALKQLISPFVLRRMKNQVLTELPSRTEINVPVELSEQEVVLYEALRRQAVENLSQGDTSQGQHHIKMLSEIMRLRRACCHPSLAMPGSLLQGSKLKAFDGLMQELMQNNHKALVFSQFVGHLKIIEQHLQQQGISYQYLDGATPAKQRSKAVNEFQSGIGDVFLISLKAGGSGLNLTAADYVIHMDPWWNPAVEDQASDRAHRMGQTRPVTIYRLIAKDTIEDKIVALHQHKRDLANSLLEGSDGISNLSAQDMMALLQTPM